LNKQGGLKILQIRHRGRFYPILITPLATVPQDCLESSIVFPFKHSSWKVSKLIQNTHSI